MLKLWENPMLSIDDRLEAASGEIERLHDQIDAARNAILREGMQRDELLRALEQIANESTRNLGSARIVARAAIAKVGAGETANAKVTGSPALSASPSGLPG